MITWQNVPGYFNFHDIYAKAVDEAPSDRSSTFVEIGVLFGRSALFMADLIKKSRKPITFYAVDPFFGSCKRKFARDAFDKAVQHTSDCPDLKCSSPIYLPSWYQEGSPDDVLPSGIFPGAREAAEAAGVHNHVRFVVGTGQKVATYLSLLSFVFIDADHSLEDTSSLIRAYLPRMCPGGTLGGHDFTEPTMPGVRQSVEHVLGHDYEVVGSSFVHRKKSNQ